MHPAIPCPRRSRIAPTRSVSLHYSTTRTGRHSALRTRPLRAPVGPHRRNSRSLENEAAHGTALERLDVRRMVDDLLSTIDPIVRKEDNTLKVTIADNAGTMHTNVRKTRQVLFNLLSNAVGRTSGMIRNTQGGSLAVSGMNMRRGRRRALPLALQMVASTLSADDVVDLTQQTGQAVLSPSRRPATAQSRLLQVAGARNRVNVEFDLDRSTWRPRRSRKIGPSSRKRMSHLPPPG